MGTNPDAFLFLIALKMPKNQVLLIAFYLLNIVTIFKENNLFMYKEPGTQEINFSQLVAC